MKSFYHLVLILSFVFFSHLGFSFSYCPREIEREVGMILSNPETRTFVESIQREGSIELQWINLGRNFPNALWSGDRRLIALNASQQWDEGKKIFSILFELHNAQTDREFIHLDDLASKRQISQSQYVESVEWIEYQNALRASQLLERGIQSGYFPWNSSIPVFPNFQEHFKLQEESGHAAAIAQKYNHLENKSLTQYPRSHS